MTSIDPRMGGRVSGPMSEPALRILVAGSRDWTDLHTIEATLAALRPPGLDPDRVVVVHGGCRGADRLPAVAAKALGYQAQAFPADWDAYPNQPWKAAHDRNQRMIDQGIPQVAVVFKHGFDPHLRRGGSEDTYRRCVAAGIPFTVIAHERTRAPPQVPQPARPRPIQERRSTAMPDNITVMVGNLTDDPELRYTPNGVAVTNFRLAVTHRIKDTNGSWRNGETTFMPVNVWRDTAENVAESLHKGDRTIVTGRLRTRSWETDDGQKRSITELDADEVAPSLRFHIVKAIENPDRTRDSAREAPERDTPALDDNDVPF